MSQSFDLLGNLTNNMKYKNGTVCVTVGATVLLIS